MNRHKRPNFLLYLLWVSVVLFTCGSRGLAQELTRQTQPEPSAASQPGSKSLMDESHWTILTPRPQSIFPGLLFPESPGLLQSIEGINFDENATNTGFYQIPPDPSGAAGPSHVVSVVNSSIEWFTKAGTNQHSESLDNFFSSLSPQTTTFDPKVIYDQYNNRFVVITLEQVESPQRSRIFVAVSDDSDPNGTWYFLDIDAKLNIGGVNHWADYPGLGVSSEAVYITANMFSFGTPIFGGSRLWIIHKTPFYSGGSATYTLHDPSAGASLGSDAFTLQPAHMFGTAPSGVGTFLVNTMWVDGSGNDYVSIIRVDDPLGTGSGPSFTNTFVNMGDIHSGSVPEAPQLGTSTKIDAGDTRTLNAVWRNDELWAVFTINPSSGSDAGQATAHWIQVNTTTLSNLTLEDQGNLDGEDIASNCYTYYPAVAINSSNEVAIGFAASASSIYPGAYYAARKSSDPAGTFQHSAILREGLDYYVRIFSGSDNRWGDYSGISVDPSDDRTFWVFNEYALTRGTSGVGTGDGRWGTAFGSFTLEGQPSPNIWINEFHYDNGDPDQGEFVEIVVPASFTDLSNVTLSLYDGATGEVYDSHTLDTFTEGSTVAGFKIYYKDIAGIQDGPDGFALDYKGSVIQFLSYEGTFVAENGPAFTETSTDVGVFETSSTPVGHSLQLKGDGTQYSSFTWQGPLAATKGAANSDQSLPVQLTSFVATAEQNHIALRWRTESELENLGFEILRATHAEGAYQKIADYQSHPNLRGQFNSNVPTDYEFLDYQVSPGTVYWYKLVDVDVNGQRTEHGPISAVLLDSEGQLTTLRSNQPASLKLYPGYPNPFNPATTLELEIPAGSKGVVPVVLTIFNSQGQRVRTLLNAHLPAGRYAIKWNGQNDAGQPLPSGVYLALLKAGYATSVQKLVLVR